MKRILAIIVLVLGMPVIAEDQPRDTHERLNGILWVQTSAEYKMLAEQTYRLAWSQIEDKLAKIKSGYGVPSAAIEQAGFNINRLPFAVILDIDETVLDNSPMSGRLIETKAGYTAENWSKWVEKEAADFIPGSYEFINKLRAANVEVIFVTNRTKAEEDHTIKDLSPIVVFDEQILSYEEKEDSATQPWPNEKTSRREYLATKYWILGMIGDDLADFIPNIKILPPEERIKEATKYQEKFGNYWFLLPNPVYGSWETVLYNRKDKDVNQIKEKMKYIRSFKPVH